MPGPALHHLIVDRLRSHISKNRGLGKNMSAADYATLQALLSDPSKLPYLFLGCQGPDFLFFNTKDMHPTLGKFVEVYFEVYDFIENFKRTLLEVVPQPVLDALAAFDEAVDEVIEDSALLSELQQTFNDINQMLEGFAATLLEMVKKFIAEFNLFDIISHPYRDGVGAGQKWWWFDALHYRKTGKYAKALLDLAPPNTPEHLYALGYLTHFSADTVGHPYVNIVSGGPYRSHAQRHKTGENYQDVLNMLGAINVDWNRSKLHALYNFNFDGTTSDPDPFTHLPGNLSQMIADAINQVYQEDADPETEYGPGITANDINNAYRIYYRWLKSATDTGTLPPPVPYSFSKELREVWEKTVDNLEEAGDFLEDAVDEAGDWGIWGIFLILAALIIAAVMAAGALADGIAGAITTLGTSTIRAAACLIYEQLYNAFQSFRLAVAANGLAFPMLEHLGEPRLTQFANPAFPDPSGANASTNLGLLPQVQWKPNPGASAEEIIFNQERHLVYPTTTGEKNPVMEAPPDYFDKFSTYYAFGPAPFNDQVVDAMLTLTPSGTSANNDDGTLLATVIKEFRMGNALDLTQAIYDRWKTGKPFPDFNLDGDRGYGYLCWSQFNAPNTDAPDFPNQLSSDMDPNLPVNLRFIQ